MQWNNPVDWLMRFAYQQSLVSTLSGFRSKNKSSPLIFSLPTIPKDKTFCSHMEKAAKIMGNYIKMTAGNWGNKISLCKSNNQSLKQQFSWKQRCTWPLTTGKGNPSLCGIKTMFPLFSNASKNKRYLLEKTAVPSRARLGTFILFFFTTCLEAAVYLIKYTL